MRKNNSYRTGKRVAVLEKMAAMRAAKERKRLECGPRDDGPRRVPAGELLGVLQWAAACGEVKRMVVRQGARANQIRVEGCRRDHGFDWLLRQVRGKLSVRRQIMSVRSKIGLIMDAVEGKAACSTLAFDLIMALSVRSKGVRANQPYE